MSVQKNARTKGTPILNRKRGNFAENSCFATAENPATIRSIHKPRREATAHEPRPAPVFFRGNRRQYAKPAPSRTPVSVQRNPKASGGSPRTTQRLHYAGPQQGNGT